MKVASKYRVELLTAETGTVSLYPQPLDGEDGALADCDKQEHGKLTVSGLSPEEFARYEAGTEVFVFFVSPDELDSGLYAGMTEDENPNKSPDGGYQEPGLTVTSTEPAGNALEAVPGAKAGGEGEKASDGAEKPTADDSAKPPGDTTGG